MPKVKSAGTKKTKAKKDPNAPKRPLSAYKALKNDPAHYIFVGE